MPASWVPHCNLRYIGTRWATTRPIWSLNASPIPMPSLNASPIRMHRPPPWRWRSCVWKNLEPFSPLRVWTASVRYPVFTAWRKCPESVRPSMNHGCARGRPGWPTSYTRIARCLPTRWLRCTGSKTRANCITSSHTSEPSAEQDETPSSTVLASLEVGSPLLGERLRTFLGVVGQEHCNPELGVNFERLVLGHAFGLPYRAQDCLHRQRPIVGDHFGDL